MAIRANSLSTYGTTPFVVATTAAKGAYTTIQSAVTAAAAAGGGHVFVAAGTFTENVAVPSNVTITGYAGQSSTGSSSHTTIVGSLTFTNVTGINVGNIAIRANGGTIPLQFIGANAMQIQLTNMTVQAAAGLVISNTNTNAATVINFSECDFYQDGAFAHFANSGSFMEFNTCFLGASDGVGITAVPSLTSGTGITLCTQSALLGGLQTTGTGSVEGFYTTIEGNGIGCDSQSTHNSSFFFCNVVSGTGAAAINVGGGSSVFISESSIFSTVGTHAVTGTGTLEYDLLSFTNGSNTTLDPGLTIVSDVIRPFATTSLRGVASFNPINFTVDTNGQVSMIGGATFVWLQTSVNVANMATQTGYFCVSPGGALTLGLPSTSTPGDTIRVSLSGATSWQITQAAGQQIRIANTNTTLGAGGSLTSTAAGDSLELVCLVANTIWVAQSFIGNLTAV